MTREELPNEASREDKMREALAHYEELAIKACWHRSDIPEAIRAYYAPLPPAEGAEEILRKNCNTCYSRSTGEEEVWSSVSSVLIAMQDFATLHAQRIAEKMVSERSEFIKKAVIRFFYTEVDLNFCTREYRDRVEWYFNTYQHEIFKLPKTSLDNFKSREK